ncbi:MAG TPA: hypothetical protein VHY08_28200 [Bacillota bacterium]|nr:hypothetical protein [Bacillota bacterium]
MAQLLGVYASTIQGGADWSAGTIPVEVTNPFEYWPDLQDLNFPSPMPFYIETPQYLWCVPEADPNRFVQQTFIRTIKGSHHTAFNSAGIPAGDYRMNIIHAADDLYVLNIFAGNELVYPSPVQNDLTHPAWRNVKSFEFEFSLKPKETLQIQSIVTNLAPGAYNPAMFTWLAKLYI